MKIYQVHEHGGEYEDYYDWIVGSYLRKERAKEHKRELEENEKTLEGRSKKCANCPFLDEDINVLPNLLAKYSDYCNNFELYNELYDGEDFEDIYCKNMYEHWNSSWFTIEEVEVEE